MWSLCMKYTSLGQIQLSPGRRIFNITDNHINIIKWKIQIHGIMSEIWNFSQYFALIVFKLKYVRYIEIARCEIIIHFLCLNQQLAFHHCVVCHSSIILFTDNSNGEWNRRILTKMGSRGRALNEWYVDSLTNSLLGKLPFSLIILHYCYTIYLRDYYTLFMSQSTTCFSPLCCLSFLDLRILITPLVYSNSSNVWHYSVYLNFPFNDIYVISDVH
jgi:hypothetical protein